MADISFNEEPVRAPVSPLARQSLLVRWVLATKIVTTPRQAEYVLIGIGIAAVILAIFFWPSGRGTPVIIDEVARPPGVVPGEVRR